MAKNLLRILPQHRAWPMPMTRWVDFNNRSRRNRHPCRKAILLRVRVETIVAHSGFTHIRQLARKLGSVGGFGLCPTKATDCCCGTSRMCPVGLVGSLMGVFWRYDLRIWRRCIPIASLVCAVRIWSCTDKEVKRLIFKRIRHVGKTTSQVPIEPEIQFQRPRSSMLSCDGLPIAVCILGTLRS